MRTPSLSNLRDQSLSHTSYTVGKTLLGTRLLRDVDRRRVSPSSCKGGYQPRIVTPILSLHEFLLRKPSFDILSLYRLTSCRNGGQYFKTTASMSKRSTQSQTPMSLWLSTMAFYGSGIRPWPLFLIGRCKSYGIGRSYLLFENSSHVVSVTSLLGLFPSP